MIPSLENRLAAVILCLAVFLLCSAVVWHTALKWSLHSCVIKLIMMIIVKTTKTADFNHATNTTIEPT